MPPKKDRVIKVQAAQLDASPDEELVDDLDEATEVIDFTYSITALRR
jgi:hypothetical protein